MINLLMKRGRHKKRLSSYFELNTATLQSSAGPIEEGAKLTIYVDGKGNWWARAIEEFNDGRFEEVRSGLS